MCRFQLQLNSMLTPQAFLLFETLDRTTWAGTLAASRAAYDSLRAHFLRAIEHPDEVESAVDPLSDIKEVCVDLAEYQASLSHPSDH